MNNITGPRRTDHGLELHTLVGDMDYLVPLWWKVWLIGGRKDSGENLWWWESGGDWGHV